MNKTATILLILCCLPVIVWGAETEAAAPSVSQTAPATALPELPAVIVEGLRNSPITGSSTLDQELIEDLPNRNGDINGLLSIMPGVQFSEGKDNSLEAGELKPQNLSISGGRANDNNFLIDGISNNSLLSPLSTINSPNDIPGHPQEIFLGAHLLDQLTVYDHNIPARHGGFGGGLIEATTKDPAPNFGGKVKYWTTRDNWTKFYVDPNDQTDFTNTQSPDVQPHFDKHYTDWEVNLPLTDSSGLLAAYNLRYAEMPLNLLGEQVDQSRRLENYYLKYLLELSSTDALRLSTTYAPYEEEKILRNTKDSQFTLSRDAWVATANYDRIGTAGDLKINASYNTSTESREAPNVLLTWDAEDGGVPTSKGWGLLAGNSTSKEGGIGDLERTQESFDINADWLSIPIDTGALEHQINFGLEVERTDAEFRRKQNSFAYSKPKLEATVVCAPDDVACVAGEQYLSKRLIYAAGSANATMNQYHLYAEDTIDIKRLEFRPGVRFSYDDFMENLDTAPRLAASYDLFGNSKTLLIGGWNRYYSRNLLVYKLREAIAPLDQQTRGLDATTNMPEAWADKPLVSPLNTKFSKLKTPYSDELILGIDQALGGGRMLIEYIDRDFRDQLAKETDPFDFSDMFAVRTSTLNNNGSSDYESVRLSWERHWTKHFLNINATYEDVKSSNESYDNTLDAEDLTEQVWYNGRLILKDELPREDFTRPWTANLTYVVELPYDLRFTNITKYQSRYRKLEKTLSTPNTIDIAGETFDIYEKVMKPSTLLFAWKFAWKVAAYRQYGLILTLDIYNVFNRKTYVGSATKNEFGLGRQYWAGIEFNF